MTKSEKELFAIAEKVMKRNKTLMRQSSSMRRAWAQGFVNGYLFFVHKQPVKKKWYEFFK